MSEPLPLWLACHFDDKEKYTTLEKRTGEYRGYRYLRTSYVDHEWNQIRAGEGRAPVTCVSYIFAPWPESLEDLIELTDSDAPEASGGPYTLSPDERCIDAFMCRISRTWTRGYYWKHLPPGALPVPPPEFDEPLKTPERNP